MRLYLRILRYLGPYVGVFLGAVVASFLFAAFDAFSMVLLIPFLSILTTPGADASSGVGEGMLDRLLDATAGRLVAGAREPQDAVQALILLILAVFAVKNVFDFLKTYLAARVEQGVTRDLRNQVHDHLLELDLAFFGRTRIGQIVSRLTHDVELVRTLFTREMMRAISAVFEVGAVAVLMVAVSPSLTLLAVAVLPGMVVIWGPMLRKLRREDGRVLDLAAEVNARIQETFSGIRLVKGSAAEDYERGRFRTLTGSYFAHFLRAERVRALAAPVTEMVAALGTIVVLWYGTRLVLVGSELTGAAFLGFVALSTKLYRPIKYLSKLPAMIQPAVVGGRRLFEYLDAPARIRDQPDAIPFTGVEREIAFERVGFAYREGRPVLEDVSLVVERGTMVAVVGPSGAGKSTLVDLLGRFLEVTSGRILIDGTDIRRFRLRSLRGMMGIVSQETVLFHDTVRANIAYGLPGAGAEEVENAARAAGAHEFIEALPDGYDTLVGERGTQLSGGQRQRLAIARAILRDPPILILDEATSALDAEAERRVRRALDRLREGRTVFVIAHRLSTVRDARAIFVLDGGRIVESGDHDRLMRAGGTYRRLHDMRSGSPAGVGRAPDAVAARS